jgi:hypothetical protein
VNPCGITKKQEEKHLLEMQRASRSAAPPCWAVFITKAWGQKIEELQQSIPLTKQEAKDHMGLLRRMEKESPMGKRYRMRKLPNDKAETRRQTPPERSA